MFMKVFADGVSKKKEPRYGISLMESALLMVWMDT